MFTIDVMCKDKNLQQTILTATADYVLKDGFYELSFTYDKIYDKILCGETPSYFVILNEIRNSLDAFINNCESTLTQLKTHYKIQTYFKEEEITDKVMDYRQELSFIANLFLPMAKEAIKPFKQLKVVIDWN